MPPRPILCLVTDRNVSRLPLVDAVAKAVAGGVDWIQIRERDLEGAALLTLTQEIVAAVATVARARGARIPIVVNRRIDVALAANVDGVHLGWDALPPREARALLGATRLVGVSAHTPAEVFAAARETASYAFLAPIFPPLSKESTRPALGAAALRAVAYAGIAVLAQGGCDATNAREVLAAGAAGIAVTGAILMDADPGAAAARLRAAIDDAARTLPEADLSRRA